jgi:pyruvate dehydrogenase E2 component (dihydrolipoamide acetyltransferase)
MEVVMPKVGLTMTEGAIAQWHKREGDFVRKGELLFTFETEKSTLEYESPEEGTLTQILIPIGQTVACFTPVAVIGETTGDKRQTADQTAVAGNPLESPNQATPDAQQAVASRPPISPRARMRARELGVDLKQVIGSGPDGAVRERDVLTQNAKRKAQGAKATPVAQRLAAELGLDLSTISGTGPDGKITREDVDQAFKSQKSEVKSEATEIQAQSSLTNYQSLTPARRVTAQRMAANAQAAPHVTLHTEADATELASARSQLNAELNEKISYNALLAAICARALKEHPALNASWIESATNSQQPTIAHHASIHIGLAVDTPRGLFVPVLKDAGAKPLSQIHAELSDLVNRTLEGLARPDELRGGTFTITNLGMFEVDGFTPIINLPEAAILGVGRIVSKPVARGEQVVVRQMMTLSLSFDHRVVDGAPAAKFLQRIKQLIERPFALMI